MRVETNSCSFPFPSALQCSLTAEHHRVFSCSDSSCAAIQYPARWDAGLAAREQAPEPHGTGVVWGSGFSAAVRGDPAWSQSSSSFVPIKLTPQGKYSRSSQAHGPRKPAQLGLSPPTRGSTSSPGQDHSCFVFGNKAIEILLSCCGAMINGGCDQRSAGSYGLCYSSTHTNTSLFTASDVETLHVLLSRVLPSHRSEWFVVTEGWRAAAHAFGAQEH